MCRIIFRAAVLLLMTAAIRPAAADDRSTCSAGNGDEAVAACSRLVSRNPRDAAPHRDLGMTFSKMGRYDRALAEFDQAIGLDPKMAVAYGGRGVAKLQLGDFDAAVADLSQAIRLGAVHAGVYGGRAMAWQGKRDFARAIADADQAVRLDPANAAHYSLRGLLYTLNGDPERAIPDYDQAIRLDPTVAGYYLGRGASWSNKGDYDRAIADLDEAVRRDPAAWLAYSARGAAWNGKGDYDRAIRDLDEAIRLAPAQAQAWSHRGFAYGHKGDFDRAAADLEHALVLNPKYARGYLDRAAVEALRGDRDRARSDYQTALDLEPKIPTLAAARQVAAALAAVPEQGAPSPGPAAAVAAPAGRRIALVIGMSAYANVAPLRNPVGDARAVADAFRRLGFSQVIEREDLTRARLEEVLKDFGDMAADADWAVIYYAGHGVEINGENYLVPVDARLARAEHVEDEAVALKRVLSKARPARRLRMVILDACRNNPFRMASAEGGPRAIGRGLSPVEPVGGVLVAYAARGGTTADDGGSEHSPFTQALLANLETPGLELNLLFRKVRDQVLARTGNGQEPFTYGSLPGEALYFREAVR